MCLMGMFKKTEYNPICKVFTEVFLIARIPHSTILLTSRIGVVTINWPHKQNFSFKHWVKNSLC